MSKENKTLDKQQNGNDFIADVSKSFCECDFAMVRRDEKTQKAYCFDCKKEIQE